MEKQNSTPDFSKILINDEYKQNSFLSSSLYTWELKRTFLETYLKKKDEKEQFYKLTKFKDYLIPSVSKPDSTFFFPIDAAGVSESETEIKNIEYYGVQPDIPIEQRQYHDYGYDTDRSGKWVIERLEEFDTTPHTKIKCSFHPSEFAFLFKLLIEKGWIKAEFDNKQNIVKLSKILLDTFEVKSPDGKLVTAIVLADKFNEKRNKAHSEYKTDLKKGILNIAHYRKSKASD